MIEHNYFLILITFRFALANSLKSEGKVACRKLGVVLAELLEERVNVAF